MMYLKKTLIQYHLICILYIDHLVLATDFILSSIHQVINFIILYRQTVTPMRTGMRTITERFIM